MEHETSPLLHPVQFPAVKSGNLSPQAWSDHVHGSTLPPISVGGRAKGKHRRTDLDREDREQRQDRNLARERRGR